MIIIPSLLNGYFIVKIVYPIVPNGFADHYPYEKWLAIIGKINPTFSDKPMWRPVGWFLYGESIMAAILASGDSARRIFF